MQISRLEKLIFKFCIKKINIDNYLEINDFIFCKEDEKKMFVPPVVLTESTIENDEFYCAYIIDEQKIGKFNSEWRSSGFKTMIIFIGSYDGVNISNYFVQDSNRLNNNDVLLFLNKIGL